MGCGRIGTGCEDGLADRGLPFAFSRSGVLRWSGQPTKRYELWRRRIGSRTLRSVRGVDPPSALLAPRRRCSQEQLLTALRASVTAAIGRRRRSLRTASVSTGPSRSTVTPAGRRCAPHGPSPLSGRALGSTRVRGAARSALRSLASLVRPSVSSSSRGTLASSLPPCRPIDAPCPGESKFHAVSACLWR